MTSRLELLLTKQFEKAVDNLVDLGCTITQAKTSLSYLKWESLFVDGKTPVTLEEANLLMQLAALPKEKRFEFLRQNQDLLFVGVIQHG